MRRVKVRAKTEEPIGEIWNLITDVYNWNNLIKFVKKIKINGKIKEGTEFYDITTILWVPALIRHKIVKIEKYKNFSIEAYLPFGNGKMFQTIEIERNGRFSDITIEIKFYIKFSLFDLLFGPVLERRLKSMIISTLKNLQKDLNKKNIKKGIVRRSVIINE